MQNKFRFLTGDQNYLAYGAKWVSPKLNNGDFDHTSPIAGARLSAKGIQNYECENTETILGRRN
jgi:hypothetical protein